MGLRNAFRGTLSVVLSFFILSFFAQHLGQPPSLAFVGVLLAMMSSLIVNDAGTHRQKVTVMMLILPAAFGLSLSILLREAPQLRIGIFLLITFFAVYLRRYGPRYLAIGFILFMAYFAPLFFPLGLQSLPWVLSAVLLSLGISFIMRFYVLPDRPRVVLRHFLKAFGYHRDELLKDLTTALEHPENQKDSRERLTQHLARLSEISVAIEIYLNNGGGQNLRSESEKLQMTLFERELDIRNLLEEARTAAAQDDLTAFSEKLRTLVQHRPPPLLSDDGLRKIERELREDRPPPPPPPAPPAGLPITTRQAIQATLATGIASYLGFSLSVDRWYWASITAFVVFAGASRGETFTRASLRVIGTLAGLVVGFVVAYLFAGHSRLEWITIVAAIFLGLASFRILYGFFTAFSFTLMLAMLFDLTGQLSLQILILRMEETVIGAFTGALVSAVILPISTRSAIHGAMARVLRDMADVLSILPLQDNEMSSRRALVGLLRNVDRDMGAVRMATAPIIRRLSFLHQPELPAALQDLNALAYYLRHLAGSAPPADPQERTAMMSKCQALAKLFTDQAEALLKSRSLTEPPVTTQDGSATAQVFLRIEQVLAEFRKRQI